MKRAASAGHTRAAGRKAPARLTRLHAAGHKSTCAICRTGGPGRPAQLETSAGAQERHRREGRLSGRASLLGRRPGLFPLGRQTPADRGRMGIRRPRRRKTNTRFWWGDEFVPMADICATPTPANFRWDTADDGYAGVSPWNAFPPNGYGLYDMAGTSGNGRPISTVPTPTRLASINLPSPAPPDAYCEPAGPPRQL